MAEAIEGYMFMAGKRLTKINLRLSWIAQYSDYNYYCASQQLHIFRVVNPLLKYIHWFPFLVYTISKYQNVEKVY